MQPVLSVEEFRLFVRFMYEAAGIHLPEAKLTLVSGRLLKRLKLLGLETYQAYYDYVAPRTSDPQQHSERQMAIDLLTTNETYFYREPAHFDFVRKSFLTGLKTSEIRCWSAACSSGEEAYTLAMVLAEHSPVERWRIDGTDVSSRMVEAARRAVYPMSRAQRLPEHYLKRYCLKGINNGAGTLLIDRPLRQRVNFQHGNLLEIQIEPAAYDLIFLRNVMIYFDRDTKARILTRLRQCLKPNGYLLVGHSESLFGLADGYQMVHPSVYRAQ
ncbi:CheR family methyltransferase [Saccharospirillum mangrovi]|uniref:CheR family methyltransferase n=1 Tax=Saccharospirillum mangrovi TaxID=2161747 RepID=UPI0018E4F72F|nr:protein-glutamate O-methyltransferase CheR [Saccharospirillum mangrovi]